MEEQSLNKLYFEGTNETDIAYALAYLAGFPKGSFIGRTNNIYHPNFNKQCLVAFHKETLDKAGHDHPMLLGPDFVVTRIKKYSATSQTWEPSNEYVIDFGPKINASLVEKIEEEIRTAYSESGIGSRAN